MAEHDEFEIDTGPPRWLRPAIWLSIPLAVLSLGMAALSILSLPAAREGPIATRPAGARPMETAPAPSPSSALAAPSSGGVEVVAAEEAWTARLRTDASAEEARSAALSKAGWDVTASPAPSRDPLDAAGPGMLEAGPLAARPGSRRDPHPAVPEGGVAEPPQAEAAIQPAIPGSPSLTPRVTGPDEIPAPPAQIGRSPPTGRPSLPEPRREEAGPSPAPPPRSPDVARQRTGEAARTEMAGPRRADPRCAPLLARLQLGERPTDADRSLLQSACAPRS
jgi:hypothetical protein